MARDPSKRYWVDELTRDHEAYWYGDDEAETVTVEHEGRSLRVLLPPFAPATAVEVTASNGDFLFLMGERQDEEDEDGEVIEGGDGVVIVARRHSESPDTYWVCVWHTLYPETLPNAEG